MSDKANVDLPATRLSTTKEGEQDDNMASPTQAELDAAKPDEKTDGGTAAKKSNKQILPELEEDMIKKQKAVDEEAAKLEAQVLALRLEATGWGNRTVVVKRMKAFISEFGFDEHVGRMARLWKAFDDKRTDAHALLEAINKVEAYQSAIEKRAAEEKEKKKVLNG